MPSSLRYGRFRSASRREDWLASLGGRYLLWVNRVVPALEAAGCDFVEQPIALSNRTGMVRLAAASQIAMVADVALHGPESAFGFAQHAAADVFAVKIAQSGGLFAAARVAAIADAAGIGLYGGTTAGEIMFDTA